MAEHFDDVIDAIEEIPEIDPNAPVLLWKEWPEMLIFS